MSHPLDAFRCRLCGRPWGDPSLGGRCRPCYIEASDAALALAIDALRSIGVCINPRQVAAGALRRIEELIAPDHGVART